MFRKRRADTGGAGEQPDSDIVCPDEASARAEAARRQSLETDGAEWIYLHRDHDPQWVARRWTGKEDHRDSRSGGAREVIGEVIGEALNPMNWF